MAQFLRALHAAASALPEGLADFVIACIQIHQRLPRFVIGQYSCAHGGLATRDEPDAHISCQNGRVGFPDANG